MDSIGPLRDGVDGMRAIYPNSLHLSAIASERPCTVFTMSVQVELDFPLVFVFGLFVCLFFGFHLKNKRNVSM